MSNEILLSDGGKIEFTENGGRIISATGEIKNFDNSGNVVVDIASFGKRFVFIGEKEREIVLKMADDIYKGEWFASRSPDENGCVLGIKFSDEELDKLKRFGTTKEAQRYLGDDLIRKIEPIKAYLSSLCYYAYASRDVEPMEDYWICASIPAYYNDTYRLCYDYEETDIIDWVKVRRGEIARPSTKHYLCWYHGDPIEAALTFCPDFYSNLATLREYAFLKLYEIASGTSSYDISEPKNRLKKFMVRKSSSFMNYGDVGVVDEQGRAVYWANQTDNCRGYPTIVLTKFPR